MLTPFKKRDIWKLYYTIFALSLIFFAVITYALWKQNESSYIDKQESHIAATAYYVENLFTQYETILDIIGKNILNHNIRTKQDKRILDQVLVLNPSLAGFGVFRADGTPFLASSNVDISKLPNLLKTPQTKAGFARALRSKHMVIDRTYYVEAVNHLVIPIRKAIRDKRGRVVAVVASGIIVSPDNSFIHSLFGENKIFLYRDSDRYLQFYDFDIKRYQKPVPQKVVAMVYERIQNKYTMPIETIKSTQKVVTVTYNSYITEKLAINSCRYIKRYGLWVVSSTPFSVIKNDFLRQELVILIIYIMIMVVIYYLVGVIDKNELQKERTLKEQAVRDSLTLLHNRLYIEEKIGEYASEYTLFFIDLDGFKSINDSFGHEYGDKVLQIIAARLQPFAQPKQRELIRYSGDEFIFVTEFMSDADIEDFCKKVLHSIAQEFLIEEFRFILGASIGVARYPDDGKSFDEVKRYADLAMYKAKEIKNSFVIFHKKIHDEYLKTATIERELKLAVERGEFSLVYQPQLYIDGEIHGVEALVRWHNEKLGDVSPAEFIHIAEATGIIKDLGRFIISQALADMYEIQQATNKEFHLSINISPKQFAQHDFLSCVMGKISAAQIKRSLISLEITESVFIDDKKHVMHILQEIKNQGIRISLDDFGTGYSSMSILRNLPIDELKIDKTFIDDITTDRDTRQIVYSIIIIARSLGLKLVAEGVESREQKEILDEFGCDIYQGFLFAKPLNKEQLIRQLHANGGVFRPLA